MDDSALALDSRSTGLGNMVREPRAKFKVAKWGVLLLLEDATKSPYPSQVVLSGSAPPAVTTTRGFLFH